LLLYERPVALSRDAHRRLRLRASGASYAYASRTNSVPLVCSEFPAAVNEYPIVFAGDDNNEALPVALLGLRQNENVFVSPEGAWDAIYVPAFVRRYPFLLAAKPDPDDFTVCIDEAYPGFAGGGEGEPLFAEDGVEAPALKQAIEFLNNFHGELKRTQAFIERLKALDLLIPRVIQFSPKNSSPCVLQGFAVVDEQRLAALDDRQAGELMRTGYMRWIYAHLLSLANVTGLSRRFEARIARDMKTT
jgi:hypothetical protein